MSSLSRKEFNEFLQKQNLSSTLQKGRLEDLLEAKKLAQGVDKFNLLLKINQHYTAETDGNYSLDFYRTNNRLGIACESRKLRLYSNLVAFKEILIDKDLKIEDFKKLQNEFIQTIDEEIEKLPQAVRDNQDKTRFDLIPPCFIREVAEVFTFGAKKYSPENWKGFTPEQQEEIKASLLRHIYAYLEGEELDPESGLSHLAHAGCNLAFLSYFKNS